MFAFLFALTLFVQGTTLQNDNGTITGVLKTSTGQPAAGVRVAAMAIPESKLDAVTGAAMASLVTNILPTSDVDQTSTEGAPTSNGAQPLAGFFGRVVEEADGRPIAQGSVTVLGRTRTTLPIGQDGMVVIPHLLAGSYDFRVEVYEHFTRYETVVIADQDVHVDLAVRSNLATADERATSQAEPPR